MVRVLANGDLCCEINLSTTSYNSINLSCKSINNVLSPSLVSKRVFRFLGLLDDSIAIAYVFNKIADKVTPEISTKVDATLDAWFGIEAVEVLPA